MIVKPKLLVLYHFYFPDDVVSARHYEDLCEDLARLNWDVEIWPANRFCRNPSKKLKLKDSWHDVSIKRVWRPGFSQSGEWRRILNSVWMILAWSVGWFFYRGDRPHAILVGTDPVFSLWVAPFIRLISPQVKIAHWCFDLYPEAAVSDQKIKQNGFLHRFLFGAMGWAYKSCNLIADLGPCMKEKFRHYSSSAQRVTVTPWAFYEPSEVKPASSDERQKLFNDAKLGILYSGNFGLAHTADLSLKLAQELQVSQIKFCFSIRGHRAEALKRKCLDSSIPVNFVDFASEQSLDARLEAADIHLVSLKEGWTGTVVPSKFFGAIAAGRPVLFEGSRESSIAKWIMEFGLGWVLTEESYAKVAGELVQISQNPNELERLKQHCLATYQGRFSRYKVITAWNELLTRLID